MVWQRAAIAMLVEVDEAFRIRYAQDPEAACAERGMRFMAASKLREWQSATEIHAGAWHRPS
jgi:hypothetical protein